MTSAARARHRRAGHIWGNCRDANARANPYADVIVRVRWVLSRNGPFESIATSQPFPAQLSECRVCGLLAARWSWFDPEKALDVMLSAYGFDLDALTLMGSAPVCDPFALTRPETQRDALAHDAARDVNHCAA